MEADEGPETLEDDFLVTHVGHGVDQADAVEGELDEVAFAGGGVEVVAVEVASVLDFLLAGLENERVGRLDVVVDDVVREDTTLALGKEEERELFVELALTRAGLVRVMNVEDGAGKLFLNLHILGTRLSGGGRDILVQGLLWVDKTIATSISLVENTDLV